MLSQLLGRSYPIDFFVLDSLSLTMQANAAYAASALFYRTRLPVKTDAGAIFWHHLHRLVWVPQGAIRRLRPDVAYTVTLFPVNDIKVPIVLDYDFNPWGVPAMRAEVDRLRYMARWMVERARVVMTRHDVSLAAFKVRFPEYAHKGVVVPSPLPGLEAIPVREIEEKFARFGRPEVTVLFVGNQPRVKGLPEVLYAWENLRHRYPVRLTVVTRFDDGLVKIPEGVRLLSDVPQAEVHRLMAESHIFIMPTKRDSHGRVFWEAMANGCALVAPKYTPHRELFGEFGETVDPMDPDDVARGLEQLLSHPDIVFACARHARETFIQKYHYSVAGLAYYRAFARAAGAAQA
jgi:glycosyltransferase involved in cell wall biosynthesis